MNRNQQRQGSGREIMSAINRNGAARRSNARRDRTGSSRSRAGRAMTAGNRCSKAATRRNSAEGNSRAWRRSRCAAPRSCGICRWTARNVFRTQARTAAMFGVPDCSEMFEIGDARARRLFSMRAEQVLNTARQARETVAEMQRQFGRIAEKQTIGMTEQVRDQIEQIGRHTEQGLQEIRDIARAEAEQAEGLAKQSLDYGDEGRFSAQNGESAQRGEELGEGSQPMQAEANGAWEPRFDDASDAGNGARENAGEADDQWKRTRRTKGGPRANRARVHVVSA